MTALVGGGGGGVAAECQIRPQDDPQLHRFLITIAGVISATVPRSDEPQSSGLPSHGNSSAVTLLTSPHLPQALLIDSRALARLRYAQMFSTEPFIIEIVWFNLYSVVLRLRQHLSPTLGEKQNNSPSVFVCFGVSRVSAHPSWDGWSRKRGS